MNLSKAESFTPATKALRWRSPGASPGESTLRLPGDTRCLGDRDVVMSIPICADNDVWLTRGDTHWSCWQETDRHVSRLDGLQLRLDHLAAFLNPSSRAFFCHASPCIRQPSAARPKPARRTSHGVRCTPCFQLPKNSLLVSKIQSSWKLSVSMRWIAWFSLLLGNHTYTARSPATTVIVRFKIAMMWGFFAPSNGFLNSFNPSAGVISVRRSAGGSSSGSNSFCALPHIALR